MLINRSKVHTAKLKISELKRKYSSDTILKQNESFPQREGNYSYEDVPNLEHVEYNKSRTNKSSMYDTCLDNYSFEVSDKTWREQTILSSNAEAKENVWHTQSKSKIESNPKHGCTLVSTSIVSSRPSNNEKSYEFSQVVNQLDNLCFISSSSDEQVKTIADFASSHKQTNWTPTTELIDEIQIILPNDEASMKLESDPIEIQDLLKQPVLSSGECSSISSSLKSKLENSDLEYSYSNTFTDSSCKTSLENHELSNLESSIWMNSKIRNEIAKDIKPISKICTTEGMKSGFHIHEMYENNPKGGRKEALNTVSEKCFQSTKDELFDIIDISYKQQLNNSLSSKDKKANPDQKLKIQAKAKYDRKIKETRKLRSGGKSHRHHKSTKPKPNVGFNENVKRPVLKSSKLIQNNQTVPNINKSSEELQYQPEATSRAGHQVCEQVINNLCLNQIQLCRHFINSHHNMYLLCCQAAKKLSKDYVNSHSSRNKDITR